MRKCLVAVDGSHYSQKVIQYVIRMAQAKKDLDITVMHVVNPRKEVYKFSPFTDVRDIEQAVIEQGQQLLDEHIRSFAEAGITVNKKVAKGDPGDEIVRYARQADFDHIVLGTRGLSNIKGVVLGSVSNKVISLAHCNITLIKKN